MANNVVYGLPLTFHSSSVVDPNALNLDPDTMLGTRSRVIIIIINSKTIFFLKTSYVKLYRLENNCTEIFSQLRLWMVNFFHHTYTASYLSYFYLCGSGSVFGISMDPDPQSSWIRSQFVSTFHNTVAYYLGESGRAGGAHHTGQPRGVWPESGQLPAPPPHLRQPGGLAGLHRCRRRCLAEEGFRGGQAEWWWGKGGPGGAALTQRRQQQQQLSN